MSLNVGEPTIVCPYPETAIDLKNGMSMSSWDQECLHWLYFALVVKAEQNQLWQLLIAYDHFKRKILQVSCMWINIKSSGKFQNMSLQWVPRGRTSPMRKNERGEQTCETSKADSLNLPRGKYNQGNYFCVCAGLAGGWVCFVKHMTHVTSAQKEIDFR